MARSTTSRLGSIGYFVQSCPSERYELYSSDARLPAAYRSLMSLTSVIPRHRNDSPSGSEIGASVDERAEASVHVSGDQDRGKGAVEQDSENEGGNTSMQGQLGHRDQNAELKNA